MAESFRDSLAMSVLRNLIRAQRNFHDLDAERIAKLGLSYGEFDILMTLGNKVDMRMGDVAQRTLASPPTITRLVRQLETKGLVIRRRNQKSEREVLVNLTPKGEEFFEAEYPKAYEFHRGLMDSVLSEADLRVLSRTLNSLASAKPEPS